MNLSLILLITLSSTAVLGKPQEAPKGPSVVLQENSYIVGIKIKLNDGKFRRCSGVMLDSKRVLTAASCFLTENHKFVKGNIEKKAELLINSVHFSALDYPEKDPNAIKAYAEKIVIHPEFNKKLETNNMAIVYIKGDVQLPKGFQFAELTHKHTDKQTEEYAFDVPFEGTHWGTFTAKGDIQLLQSDMALVDEEDCPTMILDRHGEDAVIGSNVCAEYMYTPDKSGLNEYSCEGVVGSPLFVGNKVVGINSWEEPAKYCGFGNAKVYSRVSSFLDWIESTKLL